MTMTSVIASMGTGSGGCPDKQCPIDAERRIDRARIVRSIPLAERSKRDLNPEHEIPYLLCKDCGVPCYVFETDRGVVREALCIACGNDSANNFLRGEWDDVEDE